MSMPGTTTNHKWKIGLIQPPAVYKDTLILGWAGLDWVYKTENPGTVYGIDARTGALKWTFNVIPPDMQNQTGTANVWAGISVDPETGLAFLPVSSPSPNYYGGDRLKEMPYATATVAVNAETGEVKWAASWCITTSGTWTSTPRPPWSTSRRTARPFRPWCRRQDGPHVRAEPQYRRAGLSDRGTALSRVRRAGRGGGQDPALVPLSGAARRRNTCRRSPPWPISLSFGECSRWKARIRDEGRYTPPSIRGSISWPATVGGVEWGGGALDPTTNTYVVNSRSWCRRSTP